MAAGEAQHPAIVMERAQGRPGGQAEIFQQSDHAVRPLAQPLAAGVTINPGGRKAKHAAAQHD
jgi:hypothetical protein